MKKETSNLSSNAKIKKKVICNYENCNKKLNLVEVSMGLCRCNQIYCKMHRLPETHDCSFNFTIDKKSFIKNNICIKSKIECITTN